MPRELEKGEFLPPVASVFMEEVTVELDFEKWVRCSHIEVFGRWK